MAFDAFMVFKNYSTAKTPYLKSESTTDWSNTSEPLGAPFKAAAAGNVFEIDDFSFDIEQTLNITSQSTGAGAGKVTFNPFSISRPIDVSSTTLYQNACAGVAFQNVYLGLRKATGGSSSGMFFLLFTFGLVAVKTVNWSGADGDESPKEQITLEYGALQVQYAQQNSNGSLAGPVMGAWNQMTNTNVMPTS